MSQLRGETREWKSINFQLARLADWQNGRMADSLTLSDADELQEDEKTDEMDR